ncbi:MAG: LEA type 2 family protein [Chitinophagales bacterium]|nr:LEA type 2 family protein [Chitinophagales bacterium]MCO5280496.1 LEA type 2 family protein [Chitinophagales bacterium]OJV26798.1 MAG: hypothetical protein BGO32_08075 [Bacteroidetes bacterium 37-13]HRN94586.1 LEA type 2 family protein [Chitinophagales bacterium]HRP40107.1 LEA type 2 family protein [Chitinophagales bacterium]
MKKQSLVYLLFAAFTIVNLSSCKISQPEFRRVENYKINRDGANFAIGADLVCYNPNRIKFKIQNLNANIFLNNQKVATLGKETDLKVNGRSEYSLPITISLTGQELMKNTFGNLGNLFKSDGMNLLINGNVKFKACLVLKKEFPFRYEKKLDLNMLK